MQERNVMNLNLVKPSMLLWLSDSRGQYIPRDFANSFQDRAKNVSGVSEDEWKLLEAGPDTAWHWETWDNVLNNAVVTDDAGVKFRLYQDGDLWLIPEGMEWSDESETFEWPGESEAGNAASG
jgi:hypothetical protein